MTLKVVITGASQAASFSVRAEQLGTAIGARVVRGASRETLATADVVVVIKRAPPDLAAALRSCGRPVIWDALDFFSQTDSSPRDVLIGKARAAAAAIGATAIIGATLRMADDLGSPYHLRHHGWDRGRATVREKLEVVAYEGSAGYLGSRRSWIEKACSAVGARFVVNPRDYLSADVVLAMRGAPFDTYATRNWKSGIKLSNAQIAGIPFVGGTECGYLEQASGAEIWAETERELRLALEMLADPASRARRVETMAAAAPRLLVVAEQFRRILERVAGESA